MLKRRADLVPFASLVFLCAFVLVACGADDQSGASSNRSDSGAVDAGASEVLGDALPDAPVDAETPEVIPDTAEVSEVAPDTTATPQRVCRGGTSWSGQQAFTDVTAESNLPSLGVTGIRVGAVDYDGDGDPDLVVRNATSEHDDFGAAGKRFTWLLRNDGGWQFADETEASGFTAMRAGGQGRITQFVLFGDVDNDGDLDAFSGVSVSPDPEAADHGDRNEIMLNNGDGTFSFGPGGDARQAEHRRAANAGSFLDYDRDGLLDVFVGNSSGFFAAEQDRLFRGDGAGSFGDVTIAQGLQTLPWQSIAALNEGRGHHDTWGATVCDVNDDGWPDIMASSYGRYFNALWIGGEDGFRDWSLESGYGQDSKTDWTTNLSAQCYCSLNPDAEDCAGVPGPPDYISCQPGQQLRWNHEYDREPFRLGGNTFGTACGDVDNDGDLDLMTHEIVHWDVGDTSDPAELLFNDGAYAPIFERPGAEALGMLRDWNGEVDWNAGDMTGGFLDFDNDGRLDVFIGASDYPYTRAFLFHQKADGTFEEVPVNLGIDHARAHGIGFADFDGDGDIDVALGHSRMRCEGDDSCLPTQEVHMFRNDIGQDGNWLRLRLTGGEGSNRAAIGARVRVTAGGVTQTHEIGGGHGHVGIQHDLVQHFGLGAACDIESIEIRWPNAAGTTEIYRDVFANYEVTITQGLSTVEYKL